MARETPRRKLINIEFGVKTSVIKTLLTYKEEEGM